MELVRGLPITQYCDAVKLSPAKRLELFIDVCHAVQHAHTKGVIHRDLKPSNVLVTLHDGVPVVKVIDFGVAKAVGQRLTDHTVYTAFAQMVGTPLYMSPEQAELSGLDIDTRSDVYALGVLLYELLTGETPFDSETLLQNGFDEMRRIIREEEPPRPSRRVVALKPETRSTLSAARGLDDRRLTRLLSGELDWIVMTALEKDRNRRYESARDFAADVRRFLDDEPVQAGPRSWAYQAAKFVRRHRAAVAVASILALTVASSAAFSTVKYLGEAEARQHAERNEELAVRNASEAERRKEEAVRERDAAKQNLYYADVRLTAADVAAGHLGRARRALLSHLPAQADVDRRGWEWYFLLGRADASQMSLVGHTGRIRGLAWSPDGRWLASAGADGSARIWDASTGKEVRAFKDGRMQKHGVAWSPDSKRLAWSSVANDSVLRIWDRETDRVDVLRSGQEDSVRGVAWSPDGRLVATSGLATTCVWDATTHVLIARFTANGQDGIGWSHDGKTLILIGVSPVPLLWDVTTKEFVKDGFSAPATAAAWHPSAPLVAFGNENGECVVWDQGRRAVASRWKAHEGPVTDVKWSPDGALVLSAGRDGALTLSEARTGRVRRTIAAHAGSVTRVAWEPSGRRFASAGDDIVIRVWSAEPRPDPVVAATKLSDDLHLAWSRDGRTIFIAATHAGKVAAVEADTGRVADHTSVNLAKDTWLAPFGHVIQRTPFDSGEIKLSGALAGVAGEVAPSHGPKITNHLQFSMTQVVVSPDGRTALYSARTPGEVTWHLRPVFKDVTSGRVVAGPEIVSPNVLAWRPDGRLAAVAGSGVPNPINSNAAYAGHVHLLDPRTGERTALLAMVDTPEGTSAPAPTATALDWSPDGRRIALGTADGRCSTWDSGAGRRLAEGRLHASRVTDVAWSPDGLRVASGSDGGRVHVWDAATGQQLLQLESFDAAVRQLRWSPDGRKLAGVAADGVVRVWDATRGFELPSRAHWPLLVKLGAAD
jgi:WD40 repeat protein